MFYSNAPLSHTLITALILLLEGAAAQANSVVWSLGMDMKFFITTDEDVTTCPTNLQIAESDSTVLPVLSSTSIVAGGTPSNGTASSSFRMTNGWLGQTEPLDASSQTMIQASEPSAVEANSSGGPYILYDANSGLLGTDSTTGQLVENDTVYWPNICLYDNVTGLPVVPPITNYYFELDQITSITGLSIPPLTDPTSEFLLPGCSNDSPSQDCLIARAVNGLPSDCVSNPSKRECMLALVGAFCFDILPRRLGLNGSTEIEDCFRKVPLGPCVANPSGAACVSGQFAGIAQFGSGEGSSPAKRGFGVRRQNMGPLFGDSNPYIPAEDEFWIGVMKNLINSAISLVNLLRDGLVASSKANCYGSVILIQDQEAAARIRNGCAEVFKPHTPIATLPLDGNIEKAGSIFADVVSLLFAATDILKAAQAAKFVGSLDSILAKFKPTFLGTEGGSILEATEGSNTVQIFNNYGDGKPAPFFTQSAIDDVEKTTVESSFGNCVECVGSLNRRGLGGILKRLCCFSAPKQPLEVLDMGSADADNAFLDGTVVQEALAVSQRSAGPVVQILNDETSVNLLDHGSQQFSDYFISNNPPAPVLDDVTETFYNAVGKYYQEGQVNPQNRLPWSRVIGDAAVQTYGFTPEEREAMIAWVGSETSSPELESALGKINPVNTWVITTTPLTDEALASLKAGNPGWQSKGPPGVYTIQDLFFPTFSEVDDPSKAAALSSSLGMFPVYQASTTPYRFVILSESGRYIPPVYGSLYHEVLFTEPYAGNFELLGYQELNGGEIAKAANGKPPFGVFYFREINVPAFTLHQLTPPTISFPPSP